MSLQSCHDKADVYAVPFALSEAVVAELNDPDGQSCETPGETKNFTAEVLLKNYMMSKLHQDGFPSSRLIQQILS